jgi:CRP/FNR family transcriptional regulator, cyclic AMP receptor protein
MSSLFSSGRAAVNVIAADPDLASDLGPEERRRAEYAIRAPSVRLSTGEWEPDRDLDWHPGPGDLGLLVLDGLLVRALDLHGAACAEVIGAGDVIRPWETLPNATLHRNAHWDVVAPAHMAILDRRTLALIGRWPEVVAKLSDRAIQRSHGLAFHLAVCGLPRVDLRLLAVLWNLADRWGRVTRDGVVLPLPLTHRVLGQLIAVRRPSVTTHLGQLRERGLVVPRPEGGWLLGGDPPEELEEIRSQLASHTGDASGAPEPSEG